MTPVTVTDFEILQWTISLPFGYCETYFAYKFVMNTPKDPINVVRMVFYTKSMHCNLSGSPVKIKKYFFRYQCQMWNTTCFNGFALKTCLGKYIIHLLFENSLCICHDNTIIIFFNFNLLSVFFKKRPNHAQKRSTFMKSGKQVINGL